MDKIRPSPFPHTYHKRRNETREEKIKIISSLPHDTQSSSTKFDPHYEELNQLIKRTKEEGYSFTKELLSIKEFNNPENIKRIISHYKINEKESQYPLKQFNPELILSTYEEYGRKKQTKALTKTLFNK